MPARLQETLDDALDGLDLTDRQREALAREAREVLAETRAGLARGFYQPGAQPRERAARMRALAAAARATADAERRLADALAAVWPPDNRLGQELVAALRSHDDAAPTAAQRMLFEAAEPDPERWAALESLAGAAERIAARCEREPARRGRRPEVAARWVVEGLALAWPAVTGRRPGDRGGLAFDALSPFERFALAALHEAGENVSVRVVRDALRELEHDLRAEA